MFEVQLPQPYLLFLGDIESAPYAKTAFGLRDWASDCCVAEYVLGDVAVTTGLPRLSPGEAYERGARSLVIGVAAIGGGIAPSWLPAFKRALEAGLDIVSGMHTRLEEIPSLHETAVRLGRRLINVRQPPPWAADWQWAQAQRQASADRRD